MHSSPRGGIRQTRNFRRRWVNRATDLTPTDSARLPDPPFREKHRDRDDSRLCDPKPFLTRIVAPRNDWLVIIKDSSSRSYHRCARTDDTFRQRAVTDALRDIAPLMSADDPTLRSLGV